MKCQICGRECNGWISLSGHISHFHKIQLKEYYDKYLKKEGEGVCLECGKETRLHRISNGYSRYCSRKCSNQSETTKQKSKQTNLINLGVENASQSPKIKKQKIETSQIHFGTDHPIQSEIVQNKSKETSRNNYGEDHFMKTKKGKEKVRQGCLKNLGIDNIFKDVEYIKKCTFSKLGVDNIFKDVEYIKKCNIKKWGVSNWAQTDEGKECSRITMVKRIESGRKDSKKFSPIHGKNEDSVFNIIQPQISYTLETDQTLFGFWPDWLISILKLEIEFDEEGHKYNLKDDKERDQIFMKNDYTVLRIKESDWFENKELQIIKFQETIKFLEQIKFLNLQ